MSRFRIDMIGCLSNAVDHLKGTEHPLRGIPTAEDRDGSAAMLEQMIEHLQGLKAGKHGVADFLDFYNIVRLDEADSACWEAMDAAVRASPTMEWLNGDEQREPALDLSSVGLGALFLRGRLPEPSEPAMGSCGCYRCVKAAVDAAPVEGTGGGVFDLRMARMFLCAICGNKRCPHAADHRLVCTNSNAPGQKGSLYENAPVGPVGGYVDDLFPWKPVNEGSPFRYRVIPGFSPRHAMGGHDPVYYLDTATGRACSEAEAITIARSRQCGDA